MKYFFLLFFVLSSQINAQLLVEDYWHDFEGKIADYEVSLSIRKVETTTNEPNIVGNYCYKKYDKKISLSGYITSENTIELSEISNGIITGNFKGKIWTDDKDRFEGTWTNPENTKKLDFKLTLESIPGGGGSERRYLFGKSDEEVENFMQKIKKSVDKNDKVWLSENIQYPIKVNIGKKIISIKNSNEFIAKYDSIFYPTFKSIIKNESTCNMFANWSGVMLGNGSIWIGQKENQKLKIIGINN